MRVRRATHDDTHAIATTCGDALVFTNYYTLLSLFQLHPQQLDSLHRSLRTLLRACVRVCEPKLIRTVSKPDHALSQDEQQHHKACASRQNNLPADATCGWVSNVTQRLSPSIVQEALAEPFSTLCLWSRV